MRLGRLAAFIGVFILVSCSDSSNDPSPAPDGDPSCEGGLVLCEGSIDLDSDPLNCGACNRSCLGGANSEGGVCESGACVLSCEDGWADCDGDPTNGCEAKLDEDTENCGGCGNACEAGSQVDAVLCIEGTCEIAQCTQGWDDCDFAYDTGCEADLSSDTLHCGLCDNTCAGLPNNEASACSDGECVIDCASGWGNCDEIVANGCETNLLIDAQHYGDCDNPCDTSATRASAKRSCSSAVEESILVCSGKADRCIAGGTFRRGSISLPAS